MSAPETIAATFGRTSEGLLAGRVLDDVWLAEPVPAGIKLLRSWSLSKPMAEWIPTDFYASDGIVAEETGFIDFVIDYAVHRCQLAALGRETINERRDTSWGWPDHAKHYGEGIIFYSAPSHGGFHLDAARNEVMPDCLRNADGFYEQDEQWAKVATAFPDLFTDYERGLAEKSVRNWQPDAWEIIYGRKLDPSESFMREREQFHIDHANDWIVISSLASEDDPDQVNCVATLGGRRDTSQARAFLVPSEEYTYRRHGFVIDEARHPEKPRPDGYIYLELIPGLAGGFFPADEAQSAER